MWEGEIKLDKTKEEIDDNAVIAQTPWNSKHISPAEHK